VSALWPKDWVLTCCTTPCRQIFSGVQAKHERQKTAVKLDSQRAVPSVKEEEKDPQGPVCCFVGLEQREENLPQCKSLGQVISSGCDMRILTARRNLRKMQFKVFPDATSSNYKCSLKGTL
jgi:hypothetical protein